MRDAAATDPEVRELAREDHERRRVTQRALAEAVVGEDQLRPGTDTDSLADTFFLIANSGTYQLATDVLGWSEEDWQRWLVGVLTRESFGDAPPAR